MIQRRRVLGPVPKSHHVYCDESNTSSAFMVLGGLILAESSYTYHSPLGFLFADGITLRHKAYRRSRLVDPIPRV